MLEVNYMKRKEFKDGGNIRRIEGKNRKTELLLRLWG
jgi:hypothetical protein